MNLRISEFIKYERIWSEIGKNEKRIPQNHFIHRTFALEWTDSAGTLLAKSESILGQNAKGWPTQSGGPDTGTPNRGIIESDRVGNSLTMPLHTIRLDARLTELSTTRPQAIADLIQAYNSESTL